ncbi:MAG: molybdate ABC transporter permease subunit [Chitinispirillales bacterium]|jgi:molybdate transport system permease protein|nr:molybdate ABC transporter permease subunit [Chitinispirillales bacterium]
MDLFPLYNSLRITAIATTAAFALGLLAAYAVLRLPRVVKGICDSILTIPLVLPPTVIGYFILVTLAPRSAFGAKLMEWFSVTITMRWYAAVIAVAIVAFPFVYRTARGAFESFDQNLLDAGRTLGLSEKFIFFRILLPNCKHGIIAGTVIAFARGLGEYGATSMVCGYISGKTATVSTSVAFFWQINREDMAFYWVMINLAVSVVFMVLINIFNQPKVRG